jgi:hypothetical protein
MNVLILSEDSGKDAFRVVSTLVRSMLRLVDSGTQTHRISFAPLEDGEARLAMYANNWRSSSPRYEQKVRSLARVIATGLSRGFVFYHVDGDCRWSEAPSKHEDVFERAVVRRVRNQLMSARQSSEVDQMMSRLHLIIPFYSIEAWLYQNTKVAIAKCAEFDRSQCVETFREWARDRAILDEVYKVKERVCLRDRFNLDLASSSFPAIDVYDARASFNASIERLRISDQLRAALSGTWSESS